MKVVLDSNALLVSIPRKSPYRIIFDSFIQDKFQLCISNEVLSEYMEVISRYSSEVVANNIAELFAVKSNIERATIYYRWNLIYKDPDDNKFVDLAVASDADVLVTNDAHFNILKEVEFPRVNVMAIDDFLEIIKKL